MWHPYFDLETPISKPSFKFQTVFDHITIYARLYAVSFLFRLCNEALITYIMRRGRTQKLRTGTEAQSDFSRRLPINRAPTTVEVESST